MFSVFQFMDMRNFSIFYGFVFFICREQGQKSICKLTSASSFWLENSIRCLFDKSERCNIGLGLDSLLTETDWGNWAS